MDSKEFDSRVKNTLMGQDGKTVKAAYLVLVLGLSRAEAARKMNVSLSVVSRGVARVKDVKLEGVSCPNCGTTVQVRG